MAIDDQFPPVDEALIRRLNEMYPEKCPDIDTTDRNIWFYSGQFFHSFIFFFGFC